LTRSAARINVCKREAAEDDLRGDLLAFLERFIAKRHGDYF
jgi:hypothetical protein